MSFGPSNTAKAASNNLAGTSNLALNNLYPQVTQAGGNLLNLGNQNTQSGVNYFRNLMGGNRAATTDLLQPDINRIRDANQGTLQSVSTLMPRGGGRSGTLFNASYAPNQQIQNLFAGARTAGAAALPQIGAGQTGAGANLFGIGSNSLNAATGANTAQLNYQLQQQELTNKLWAGLGSGLFNLAMTPFGGGSGLFGLFGGGGGGGGGNGLGTLAGHT